MTFPSFKIKVLCILNAVNANTHYFQDNSHKYYPSPTVANRQAQLIVTDSSQPWTNITSLCQRHTRTQKHRSIQSYFMKQLARTKVPQAQIIVH